MSGRETAIEVRDLAKTFRIPTHASDTLKERAVRRWARPVEHELEALAGVSFDVGRGEFFGVVGRNGSGKSTLLRCLAGIYHLDRGTIAAAGRVSPFIELAVGFNVEFTAHENAILNGVMMGLTRKEAERRFDSMIEFAELEDFAEMKLKNYSSGMLTRLAFSIMVQVDADVMLIDEVLAVGDAGFQRKCSEVFADLRGKRTILFVSHDMSAIERFCHRAMLLDGGRVQQIGEPGQVARSYLEINRPQAPAPAADAAAAFTAVWVENAAGQRPYTFAHGDPITFKARIEPLREIERPRFSFQIRNAEGAWVYSLPYAPAADETDRLAPGEPVEVAATLESPFAGGQYSVNCTLVVEDREDDLLAVADEAVVFVADGPGPVGGLAATATDTSVSRAERVAGTR